MFKKYHSPIASVFLRERFIFIENVYFHKGTQSEQQYPRGLAPSAIFILSSLPFNRDKAAGHQPGGAQDCSPAALGRQAADRSNPPHRTCKCPVLARRKSWPDVDPTCWPSAEGVLPQGAESFPCLDTQHRGTCLRTPQTKEPPPPH